jgi:hypothetical protein
MRRLVVPGIVLGLTFVATAAMADESAPPKRGPIEIKVDIKVHRQQPLAAIQISRVDAVTAARALRQPFVDRIEQAATRDPF